MPKKDRSKFLEFIQMDKNFLCFEGGIAVCYCLGDNYLDYFPDLVFHIDGHQYFIPKESYVIRTGGICQIAIMTHDSMSLWILGLNFFENYYTVFDQENLRVGFAINKNADPRLKLLHDKAELNEKGMVLSELYEN